MIVIQVAWDWFKNSSAEKSTKSVPSDEIENERVIVIDSVPEMMYTYDPDSLLKLQSGMRDEEGENYILKTNAYSLFLKKEKMMDEWGSFSKIYTLPAGARVIEYVSLKDYPGRGIILWMRHPRVYIGDDEEYTCPEVTSGKGYYIGKVNLSLLDEKEKRVINTLNFSSYEYTIGDTTTIEQCFVIPFAIGNPLYRKSLNGFKYHVTGGDKVKDGMAHVLSLNDYNGDGKELEFALFHQENCMSCNTTLFGYSYKTDKLIHYDINVKFHESVMSRDSVMKDSSYAEVQKWMNHLFRYRIDRSTGEIEYDVDWRGRGGLYTKTKARYDEENERFVAEIDMRSYLQNDSIGYSFYSSPVRIK